MKRETVRHWIRMNRAVGTTIAVVGHCFVALQVCRAGISIIPRFLCDCGTTPGGVGAASVVAAAAACILFFYPKIVDIPHIPCDVACTTSSQFSDYFIHFI